MKELPLHVRCPGCQGALVPTALSCEGCGVTVQGHFALNEFAGLGEESLHFLRIFVHCEGRIRDMESALGVSYPTIKARLAKLKEALAAGAELEGKAALIPEEVLEEEKTGTAGMAGVLKELEAGRISFEDAMRKIKNIRAGDGT